MHGFPTYLKEDVRHEENGQCRIELRAMKTKILFQSEHSRVPDIHTVQECK
jgi:hypothetical protein